MNWPNIAAAFYLRCEGMNLSRRTQVFYHEKLGHFLRWVSKPPQRIERDDLRRFLAIRASTAGPQTVDAFWRVLKTFFGFLVAEQLLNQNPTEGLERPRKEHKIPVQFTDELLLKTLAVLDPRRGLDARDYALILLYADSGARLAELLALDMAALSYETRTLKLYGKGGKERLVAFGDRTTGALKAYLSFRPNVRPEDPLFINRYGDRMKENGFEQRLKAHTVRAGIARRRLNAHALRHYFGVSFLRSGGNAFALQEILGHATLEMTRTYARLANVEIVEQQRKASPMDRLGMAGRRVVLG